MMNKREHPRFNIFFGAKRQECRVTSAQTWRIMDKYEQTVKTWKAWKVRTVADLDLRLDSFRILFAFNSGKIENPEVTFHDTREIFENGKIAGFSGNPRTLFEQQNQKTCYAFLCDKIVSRETLNIALIKEVHRALTEGTYDEKRYIVNGERPGEFKKHDYVTGVNEVGSYPEEVDQDMTELIDEVNSIGAKDPLKAGAYFHARFENIHPFADGNGRVGRTLLNYRLMINDYPPTIIFDEDKGVYYSALQRFDEDENLDTLAGFIREQTVKTWTRVMRLTE